MPWLIQHKCNDLDGARDYGMAAAKRADGSPITVCVCPNCKEKIVFEGHEVFDEAETVHNLPPGFVVARTLTD